eukprot:g4271.t1
MADGDRLLRVCKRLQSGPIACATMTLDLSEPSFPVVLVEARDRFARTTEEEQALIISLSEALEAVKMWDDCADVEKEATNGRLCVEMQ